MNLKSMNSHISRQENTVRLDDRLKKLLKNIFGSAAARFVNLFTTLLLVPLTVNALSPIEYAFLSMAISLSILSSYSDLGMGMAIVNTLAAESSADKPRRSQRAISVVWFTLLTISGSGLVLLFLVWIGMDQFASTGNINQYQALLLSASMVLLGLPSGLIQRILFARHCTTEANAWSTAGRLLSLAFVWILVKTDMASLPLLVFGVIGVPVVVSWLSVLFVFTRRSMRLLKPKFSLYDRRLLKPYFISGLSFMCLQMVPYVETGMDTLLVGFIIGTQQVPALDVFLRLFTYVPALVSIALFPLWPAIAHAKAAGDILWIMKIRRWAIILVSALATIISLILLIYGQDFILWWTSKQMHLPLFVLFGLGVFSILTCIGLVQSMILNGIGVIGRQVRLYLVYLFFLFVLKFVLLLNFGLLGMIWALNGCFIYRLIMAEKLSRTQINVDMVKVKII